MRNKQKSQVISSFPFPQASSLSCLSLFLPDPLRLASAPEQLLVSPQNALTPHPPAAWPTCPGRSPAKLWLPILRPATSAPEMVLCKCQSPCPSLGWQRTQESEWGGVHKCTSWWIRSILRKPRPRGAFSACKTKGETPVAVYWGEMGPSGSQGRCAQK